MEITYEHIRKERILAIDPMARGFGYVILEDDPLRLVDWGTRTCKKATPSQCVDRLGGLVIRYQPSAMVLEDASEARTPRAVALEGFIGAVAEFFANSSFPIRTYSREAIRQVFQPTGALSKEGIMEVLVAAFPELRATRPPFRKIWESEDARTSVFDALSLALTHLSLGKQGSDSGKDRAEPSRS